MIPRGGESSALSSPVGRTVAFLPCVSGDFVQSPKPEFLVSVQDGTFSSAPRRPGLWGPRPSPPRARVWPRASALQPTVFLRMASPLAVIHLLVKLTAHFQASDRRLTQAARPLPGPPRTPPARRPADPARTAQRTRPASETRRPRRDSGPRGKGLRRASPAAASVAHARGPRFPAPLPSPGPRLSAGAPAAAAALGGLSLAARRSPALAGRRFQDGRGASGSCGGLEAEAEPSHSRTSGLPSPAPGCSLLPAAAMRGPVHG